MTAATAARAGRSKTTTCASRSPLSVDGVRETETDRLDVYDPTDTPAHAIPVSADDAGLTVTEDGVDEGRLLYEQSLGHRPFHGRYRVVAVNATGERVDFLTVRLDGSTVVDD